MSQVMNAEKFPLVALSLHICFATKDALKIKASNFLQERGFNFSSNRNLAPNWSPFQTN
tara:strand:+ start:337 stop:513 length:177 start_codon:yes stop_codon:yes gene_type:complete